MRPTLLAPMRLTTRGILPVLLTLLLFFAFVHVSARTSHEELEKLRAEARESVQQILGIHSHHHKGQPPPVPPEFITKFYKMVTDDTTGETQTSYPFNSNMVRSYYETVPSVSGIYLFQPIILDKNETVLEGQFHVFVQETSTKLTDPCSCCTVKVYQIMEDTSTDTPELHKLLTSQHICTNVSGWQVFDIKQAVVAWTSGNEPQLGLLVVAYDATDQKVHVDFYRGIENDPMRPVIVLFDYEHSQDNVIDWFDEKIGPAYATAWDTEFEADRNRRSLTELANTVLKSLYVYVNVTTGEMPLQGEEVTRLPIPSLQRALEGKTGRMPKNVPPAEACQLHPLYVNFTEMEMDDFIIIPKGYRANNCVGLCTAPILQDITPTNHAIIHSLLYLQGLVKDLKAPSCVPTAYASISIIFKVGDSVTIRPYKDIVAKDCGCR